MEAVDARHLLLMTVLVVRLQEDGTQGGRQRQGVQGRDKDADSHCHTELAVERTRGAADERHGDEHRGHHQRNGYDSARNLVHGVDALAFADASLKGLAAFSILRTVAP